jgi:23S rRNA pseudouridine2605 synthase
MSPTTPDPDASLVRLQKVLAAAGIGSRRHSEDLIGAGRVSVDGETVQQLGRRVDPARAVIRVDGELVPAAPGLLHLALNKPAGVLSAMSDRLGRRCLADLLPADSRRLYHVGRLDAETEGLLLLTNDGELANRLMHPSYEVPKTYLAEVTGPLRRDVGRTLRRGVELADGVAKADSFRVVDSSGNRVLVELVVHEGRKHVVRRMLDELGYPVQRLVRTAVGPVQLGELRPGRIRKLTPGELRRLYRAISL